MTSQPRVLAEHLDRKNPDSTTIFFLRWLSCSFDKFNQGNHINIEFYSTWWWLDIFEVQSTKEFIMVEWQTTCHIKSKTIKGGLNSRFKFCNIIKHNLNNFRLHKSFQRSFPHWWKRWCAWYCCYWNNIKSRQVLISNLPSITFRRQWVWAYISKNGKFLWF